MSKQILTKALPAVMGTTIQDVDQKQGIVSVYWSSFNFKDDNQPYGDIVRPGAFRKTIVEGGPDSNRRRIKFLFQHNTSQMLGIPSELKEDNFGLFCRCKISQTSLGKDVLILYNDGVITEHSIGYDIVQKAFDASLAARLLLELKLFEGSAVCFGMNEHTPTVSVKDSPLLAREAERMRRLDRVLHDAPLEDESLYAYLKAGLDAWETKNRAPDPTQDRLTLAGADGGAAMDFERTIQLPSDEVVRAIIAGTKAPPHTPADPSPAGQVVREVMGAPIHTKGASGKTDWPLGPDRAWDHDAALQRIVTWATDGDGQLDAAKMRSVHFWSDPEKPDVQAGYKLLFCDFNGGEVKAMPGGIRACANVLQGARHAPDIPDADLDAVKRKVAAYYSRMAAEADDDSIVAPWQKTAPAQPDASAMPEYARLEAIWLELAEKHGLALKHPNHGNGTGQEVHGKPGAADLYHYVSEHGGATYNVLTREMPTKGYSVSIYPQHSQVVPLEDFTPMHLKDYIRQKMSVLKQPGNHLGIWADTSETKKVFMDVVVVEPDLEKAKALGRKHHQRKIYDLEKGVEIETTPLEESHFMQGEMDEGQGGTKAAPMDFNTAYSQAQVQSGLYDAWYSMIDGLRASLWDILEDAPSEDVLPLAKESLLQFCQAVLSWMGAADASGAFRDEEEAEDAGDEDGMGMDDGTSAAAAPAGSLADDFTSMLTAMRSLRLATKEGRKMSKATHAAFSAACDQIGQGHQTMKAMLARMGQGTSEAKGAARAPHQQAGDTAPHGAPGAGTNQPTTAHSAAGDDQRVTTPDEGPINVAIAAAASLLEALQGQQSR